MVAGGIGAALALGVAVVYLVALVRQPSAERHPFFAELDGQNRPLVVAHQGGELLAPSNTMAVFEHAVALGADMIDTDLHRSADGALVLLHDETVDRTTNGTGAVRDLTLAELQALDAGYSFTTDDGATFPYRGQGATIVTAEELFAAFADRPRLRYGIEIKQTGPEAADELCALIRADGLEERVLVSSFAQPNMDAFRRACPEVATSATEDEVRSFYLLHRVGLSDLASPDYDCFQIPETSGRFRLVTADFLADAADHGLPVIPWTIDDPDDMARLIGMGVDGINTNRPDLLVEQSN